MRPEDRLRARCRMYLNQALPDPGFWTAIEHGRMHTGTPEQRAREWERLKGQGVKTGLSDLMIWYRGMFIGPEAKVGRNDTSDAQDKFGAAMVANGFHHFVFRSVVELHEELVRLGIPIAPAMRGIAAAYDDELAREQPVKKKAAPRRRLMKAKPTQKALAFTRQMYGV